MGPEAGSDRQTQGGRVEMKKVLLFCIVGLLCMGSYSYAEEQFDRVDIGAWQNAMYKLDATLNIVQDDSLQGLLGATGTVQLSNGYGAALSNGDTLFSREIFAGDTIYLNENGSFVKHTVTTINGTVLTFSPVYQGSDNSNATIWYLPPMIRIENNEADNLFVVSDAGHVGISKSPNANALAVNGSVQFGSTTPGANSSSVLCWTTTGSIGRCTTAPNSAGKCTCTAIN